MTTPTVAAVDPATGLLMPPLRQAMAGTFTDPTTPEGAALASGFAVSGLPAGIEAPFRVDPANGVYNRQGSSLRKWRAALNRQEQTKVAARVVLQGNSIGQGANSSAPYFQTSWFGGRLPGKVLNRFPDGGRGWNPLNDTNSNADTRLVTTGTWSTLGNNMGIGQGYALTTVDPTATLTYTPASAVNSIKIVGVTTTDGGTATVKVNGTTAGTINCNGTQGGLQGAELDLTVTGTPTITITAPSGGARMSFTLIVEQMTGVGGVQFAKFAINGSITQNHVQNPYPSSELNLIANVVQPDLTLIDLITNDWGQAVPIATFKQNMTTMIQNAQTTGDVVLMVPIPGSDRRGTGSGTIPLDQSPVFDDFVQATYDLATEFDLMVIDLRMIYGEWADANAAGLMSDDYHPNDMGHRAIAQVVFSALFEGWQSLVPPAFGSSGIWTAQQFFTAAATKFGNGSTFLQVGLYAYVDTTKPYLACTTTDLMLSAASNGFLQFLSNMKMGGGFYLTPGNASTIAWRLRQATSQSASMFRVEDPTGTVKLFELDKAGRPIVGSNLPTAASTVGTAAVTNATSDPAHSVTVATSSAVAAGGVLATVTFSAPYGSMRAITLQPRNAPAVAAGLFTTAESATSYSIATANGVASGTTLSLYATVIGG
ncbi:SGNH/GDSL hydrolase family protein [Curtobacterium sp. MCBD17_028]|uniref:SGNH/GDSL hydrolase family protein n=1 Tax=Curtobacterium sp. MCBD17_028 TaxID=2175670 RepID=UPI000DA89979|nr:SGNH/GDSL hydrolase family protein [Curtobacterium sp. MCBD17_028]PZE26386.1 hypothetical protein DEI86_07770 [Curtobacterium sp. MCBD17_028]